MEVRIADRKENKLLDREELYVIIDHKGGATPKRDELRKKIAAMVGKEEDLVVIYKIFSVYGVQKSRAIVHVYNNKEAVLRTEPKHILKRNKIVQ